MTRLSFFSPGYLWGLLFLAVPVAVHLFNRKRTIDLAFSSTRFFHDVAIKANRARNLRRFLQLLARIAAVAAVVIAFAQPYNAASPFTVLTNPQARIYCWSDHTISMGYREKSATCSGKAGLLLDTLVSSVPRTARVMHYSEQSDAFVDPGSHWGTLSSAVRFGPSRFENVGASLSRSMAADPAPSALILFTDCQAPTTDRIDRWLAAGPPGCPVVIVSLTPPSPWNFGVGAAGIAPETPGIVHATLYKKGRKTDYPAVYVQCGSMRVGHTMVSAAAGDTAHCSIAVPPDATVDRGLVRFDMADPFAFDNVSYFVKPPAHRGTILIIGDPESSYPLYAALASLNRNGPTAVVLKPVDGVSREDLDAALIVVLNEVVVSSQVLDAFLDATPLHHTAVLFAPSLSKEAIITNRRFLRRFGQTVTTGMDSAVAGRTVVLPDTISNLWQGFPRITDSDVRVYRWLNGLPGDPILRLDNRVPFAVSAADAGGNRWIVLAGPLGATETNNLCETGFFVPLVDRLVRHAGAGLSADIGVWIAGTPRSNPYYARRGRADVYNADGTLVATWTGQPVVQFDRPGLYRVQPFGEASYWIAATIDSSETELTYRHPSVPVSSAALVRVVSAADFVSFVKSCGGAPYTRWLWLALALLLLAEIGLWNWRPGERPRIKAAQTVKK